MVVKCRSCNIISVDIIIDDDDVDNDNDNDKSLPFDTTILPNYPSSMINTIIVNVIIPTFLISNTNSCCRIRIRVRIRIGTRMKC